MTRLKGEKLKLIVPNNKKDLIGFSKQLIEVQGEKAKSVTWLRKNGYGLLISRAQKYYGKWSTFTEEADFKNHSMSQ